MSKFNISDEELVRYVTKFDDLRIDNLCENEDDFNYIFTDKFECKMKRVVARERRMMLFNHGKRFAIGLCIILLCIGTLSFSVDAIRVRMIEIIKQIKSEYTMFMFSKESDYEIGEFISFPVPQYIPEGFDEIDRFENSLGNMITYENNYNSKIIYTIDVISNNTVVLDTEDAIVEEMYIGECKAEYIEKADIKQIIWNDNEYIYLIYCSSLEKEELIKIAQNIRKKQ